MRPWFSAPLAGLAMLTASIAGCAGATGSTATHDAIAASTPAVTALQVPATTVPTATADPWARVSTKVKLGGGARRSLFLICEGPGPTTVVYLHGMAQSDSDTGKEHATLIAANLRKDLRICRYDRANVGESDPVLGKQTAANAVSDLRQLLLLSGILDQARRNKVFLLGASFGGLIADEYAVTYPDDVAGMVVLDPTLPREYLDIDPFYHPDDGLLTGEEWRDNKEHMDWLGSMQETSALEGQEPGIPLTFFALVHPATWWHPVTPESIAAYRAMQHRFVDLWSPGTYIEVDTPHYMEPVIPDQIADAVRELIAHS